MVKNTKKNCRRFVLHKINNSMQKNQAWNVLHICRYDVITSTSKLCNFVKTDQIATKLSTKFFLHEINKDRSLKQGYSFSFRYPLKERQNLFIKLTTTTTLIPFNCLLFSQKVLAEMLDQVLNAHLKRSYCDKYLGQKLIVLKLVA